MMSFKKIIVTIAALSTLFLGACGADIQTDMPQETIPQYTLPPVIKEAVPTIGGEMIFPAPKQNPTALNPLKTKNVELYNMLSLIYEQPIRIGSDGKAQPELSETWEVDATGTIWTFHLRKGVKWQGDNGEMTSADVIYTIDQIKTYTDQDSSYAHNNSLIASYTATDEYTIQITQTAPGYAAIYFMTFPVLCKSYCESNDIDTDKPVGTGAYQVTEIDMEEQVSFEVNPSWWKQAPYIQSLTAICIPDHDAEMSQFEQNLIDIVTTSSLTVETYQKFEKVEYIDYLTHYYDCLVPSTRGLLADVNLRLAIAYALDKRSVVSKALLGHAVAVDYPVSPDSYLSGGSSKLYEYNQQKARALLELSGWTNKDGDTIVEKVEGDSINKLTLKLLVSVNNEDTYRIDVAQNIAVQLAECGISVEIDQQEPDDYKASLDSGSFDMALCTFYMDTNPDISFLVGTDGSSNYGGFTDSMLDGLLANCSSALSDDALKTAYSSMEDYFLTQMPQIALYYRTNALLYDAKLNLSDNLREKNLFSTIPQWYRYVEEPEG